MVQKETRARTNLKKEEFCSEANGITKQEIDWNGSSAGIEECQMLDMQERQV